MAVQLLKAEPGTTSSPAHSMPGPNTPPRPRLHTEPAAPPPCLSQAPLKGRQAGYLSPNHGRAAGAVVAEGGAGGGGPVWQTGRTHRHSDSSPATRACPRARADQDQVRSSGSFSSSPPSPQGSQRDQAHTDPQAPQKQG